MSGTGRTLAAVDDRLLRALGAEMIRINRRRSAAVEGAVLDGSAFRILWLLVETGPLTLRQLAEELMLEQSTINRQVNAAIRRGLLERFVADGATGRLRPTEAGRAAYEHDGRLRAVVYAEVLEEFGPHRAERLVRDLADFNDALDRAQNHDQNHDQSR